MDSRKIQRLKHMKNRIAAKETLTRTLMGKRLAKVTLDAAHGELLELMFEDGTKLKVCSTHGIDDATVPNDPNDIYISINDKAL